MKDRVKCTTGVSKMRLGAARRAISLLGVLLTALIGAHSAQSQTYNETVVYSFQPLPDGANPYAGVFKDKAGNLYGTTSDGGSGACNDFGYPGCGVVFKIDPTGIETVLYDFMGGNDGDLPFQGLVGIANGTLYGTTYLGGSGKCNNGCGVIFKLDARGGETVLHSFAGGKRDGCNPAGRLFRDKTGNLYGTTAGCGASGYGTVFKLDPAGKETVLHSFTGSDGAAPGWTSLVMDKEANLYGIAESGGGGTCVQGCGTVYKLSKSKKLTVLHIFAGGTGDGCFPLGIPVMDNDGNLYGTTEECGGYNVGIVWRISLAGVETVLHDFTGTGNGSTEGGYPLAGVVPDANGNLYGTTNAGGSYNAGTVYELDPSGTLTILHAFGNQGDGSNPIGGVTRDAKGDIYGTTTGGGSGSCPDPGCGTVWKLTP